MTHNAEHTAEQGGPLPDDPMSLLLGSLDPDLAAAVAAQLTGVNGGAQQGPAVFMGETQTPTTRTRIGNVDRNEQRGSVQRGGEMVSDVRTLDEAVAEFYAWSDSELSDFQERAFNAGLYGTRDRNAVRFGDPTDAKTFNIWADMVQAAAGFYNDGGGRKVTPWDAVDLAVRGAPAEEGPPPLVARVTNPEDIVRSAREGVRSALGFVPDDIDFDALVRKRQGQEVAYQSAVHSAGQGGGGTIAAPMDDAAFADIEAKRLDPTAYDSRKVVSAADYLAKKLRGQV